MRKVGITVLFSMLVIFIQAQDFKLKTPVALSTVVGTSTEGKSAYITEDGGSVFLLTRAINTSGQGQELIEMKKSAAGVWEKNITTIPYLDDVSFNTVIGSSRDGQRLYLLNKFNRSLDQETGVYVTSRSGADWAAPLLLEVDGMRTRWKKDPYYGAHLNQDEDVLFLSLNDPRVRGKELLYVSNKLADNTWSWPRLLGDNVNSLKSEVTPYLSSDKRTLYFASTGHGGTGSYDLWESVRMDDTWENWSEPENLGTTFNNVDYNANIITASEEQFIWLTGTDEEDAVWMYTEVDRPPLDSDGDGIPDLEDDCPNTAGVSSNGGCPEMVFPAEAPPSEVVSLPTPEIISIPSVGPVYFSYHVDYFELGTNPQIQDVLSYLKNDPDLLVRLIGHTDNVSSSEFNFGLSMRRASYVRKFIIDQGISPSRIITVGMGEDAPISNNTTESGKAMNRRVEFEFFR